jgi:glycosyltransferase involved in cell wall biosynthesis
LIVSCKLNLYLILEPIIYQTFTPLIQTYCQRTKIEDHLFTIVIPSWNNLGYLQLCIESIRKNSQYKHQIVVHLNEAKDGSLEWVKSQSDIDYTFSEKNIGICYSLNAARTIAKTNYFFYLNDDMYLCPKWDTILKHEIDLIGHDYFFLSGTLIEPSTNNPCAIQYDFGTSLSNFKEAELLEKFDSLVKSDWCGSTWPPNIVPIKLWDLIGGYSIEYSPGLYSDPDFSMKLWKAGVRYLKGVSQSRVYHFGSTTLKRVRVNNGYKQFINKWGMTPSVLTKWMLHSGKEFNGPLKDFNLTGIMKWKQKIKKILQG